jgi:hypothetical protein
MPPAISRHLAAYGDIYFDLWQHPIVVAVMTAIVGLVFLRETKDVDMVGDSGVAIQSKA